jgi:hypothetical protein
MQRTDIPFALTENMPKGLPFRTAAAPASHTKER